LLLVAPLGAGSYGGVYSALDLRTGKQYAVKHVDTSRLTPQQTAMQRQEPTLHSKCLGHTGVLPLHSALDVEDGWCLVLGHAESGDLFDAVTGGSLWRDCRSQVEMEARSRVIFAQVCEAVAHCHSSGVYHRDLKPENILLTWTPPDEEEEGDARKKEGNEGKDGPHSPSSSYHSIPGKHPRIWLSDFGLATECPLAAERGCGSAYYMAPESNLSTLPPRYPYISSAADVWSLGVLLANLASRRNPWQRAVASDPMYSRFLRHRSAALARSLHVSKALASILARVFSEDPRKRPSILELRDLVLNVPCFSEELELEEEVS
ncbi:MAG: kinase-like domain-containing protein, partial [Piptocephalis tieghemiana]